MFLVFVGGRLKVEFRIFRKYGHADVITEGERIQHNTWIA